jgi:hypothetical protein
MLNLWEVFVDGIEIIKKNLSMKMDERRASEEKIAALYSELAYEMLDGLDNSNLTATLAELSETVGELFEPLDAFSMASFADRFVFRLSEMTGRKISLSDFFGRAGVRERVAYVKNRYNDIAYERLCPMLKNPTVGYFPDTDGVIASLAEGRADYALIPTAQGGVRIPSVYETLDEHMLHIFAKYECEQTDGKMLEISIVAESCPFSYSDGDTVGISFSFYPSPACDIGAVLTAMSRLGASVGTVTSEDNRYFVGATATSGQAVKIITFMYLFTYGFNALGVFREI